MINLSKRIEIHLGRKPDFIEEIILEDIGDGVVYIKEWNASEAQPTVEELKALSTQAQTAIDNELTKQETDKASGNAKLKALGLTDDEIKAIKS
tara:strand:+ start:478 stop:759 length:282 start_codon:yes stop_codon:yes gene_type:complete